MRLRNPGPKKLPRGRAFPKGNKFGGRKKIPDDVKRAFELLEPDAIGALKAIVNSRSHMRREQAAEYIVNRVRGTPASSVHVSGPDGQPLNAGPMQISVSFCTTQLSAGNAEIKRVGPDAPLPNDDGSKEE